MPSLKKNIILNGLNTVTAVIFPVITFPYAARVLLPEGIGTINFLNSIVGYIILFTTLGIPMYAVKEIVKFRNDLESRNQLTVEIILFSLILCLSGYVAVWVLASFVPQIHQNATLFYILSLSILFSAIGIDWFYQGIEDFKFITIRAIIVRVLAAASLFIFVKDSHDLLIYGIINVGSTVGNNIINLGYLGKHIDFRKINYKDLKVFRHLKPSLHVFLLNLIINLYIQLNAIMLGFISGEEAVGFYAAGTKISHIGLVFIGSLSTALFPRSTHLFKSGDKEGYEKLIAKSINVTMCMTLPMAAGLMLLATPITTIFCGEEYLPAIPVLLLNAPVIIFVSLANIMGIQILYAMDKLNYVIIGVSAGAAINLILNFIILKTLGATGAAVSTFCAELTGFIIQFIFARKFFRFHLSVFFNIRYWGASLIMSLLVFGVTMICSSDVSRLIIGSTVGLLTYVLCLAFFRDPLMKEAVQTIKGRMKFSRPLS